MQDDLRKALIIAAARGIQVGFTECNVSSSAFSSSEDIANAISLEVQNEVKQALDDFNRKQVSAAVADLEDTVQKMLDHACKPGPTETAARSSSASMSDSESSDYGPQITMNDGAGNRRTVMSPTHFKELKVCWEAPKPRLKLSPEEFGLSRPPADATPPPTPRADARPTPVHLLYRDLCALAGVTLRYQELAASQGTRE